jgi:hypothetical protein
MTVPKTRAATVTILTMVLVLTILVGARMAYLKLSRYPIAEGGAVASPDNRYWAGLYLETRGRFFGGVSRCYRLQIAEGRSSSNADKAIPVLIDRRIPLEEAGGDVDLTDSRSLPGFVQWASNSQSVTYVLPDMKVELAMPYETGSGVVLAR